MRNPFKRTKKTAATSEIHDQKGAEAGFATSTPSDTEPATQAIEGKLLVMGRESAFSSEVVDYAIDMARRMSFEILALNSAPLSCDSFNLFSTSRSKLCQEFQSISEENVLTFRQAADANRIPFTHVVKFDDPEQALTSLQREHGNIEFVISDSPQTTSEDRVADSHRPRNEVLVYSMI
jgi:hypothetical protein